MQSEFLAVTPRSNEFVSTLNRLEWTESQRNAFNEYTYTNGQQLDVCRTGSVDQVTNVSQVHTICITHHIMCTTINSLYLYINFYQSG